MNNLNKDKKTFNDLFNLSENNNDNTSFNSLNAQSKTNIKVDDIGIFLDTKENAIEENNINSNNDFKEENNHIENETLDHKEDKFIENNKSLNQEVLNFTNDDNSKKENELMTIDKELNKKNDIDNSDNYKPKVKTKKSIFANANFLTVILLLIFALTCYIVGRVFYLSNKIDNYEQLFITVEKEDTNISIYEGNSIDNDDLKEGAASELVSCLNKKIDINDIPDSINNVIEEINNYYNESNDYFAYYYKDIYTGFTVSYNENQTIATASTIKAPTDIYIWEMASNGLIDLDEKLTYTSGYYNTGSGLLKDKNFDTEYDIRTLLEYSTVYSDNAAHNMLMDRFKRNNMLDFWQEKGTTAIFTQSNNWGVLNAHDASIYMEELYRFYIENNEYGNLAMNDFIKSSYKFITSEYTIANKSGWNGSIIHDVAIIFADNPYILVALSNTGASNYNEYFSKVSNLTDKLHTQYWKYKIDLCNDIRQY